MDRSRYEVLFLDLDGTLVDYDRTEQAALREVHLTSYAEQVGFADFCRMFADCNDTLWAAYRRGEGDLDRLRLERFAVLGEATGAKVRPRIVAARYEDSLGRNAALFGDVRSALRVLARRFRLVLVTDGIARVQHHKLSRTRLSDLFEQVVISTETGFRKPQPELLWHALEMAKSSSATALVVGDSMASDGLGASLAGLDFCWLRRTAVTATGRSGLAGTGGSGSAAVPARLVVPSLRTLARVLADTDRFKPVPANPAAAPARLPVSRPHLSRPPRKPLAAVAAAVAPVAGSDDAESRWIREGIHKAR